MKVPNYAAFLKGWEGTHSERMIEEDDEVSVKRTVSKIGGNRFACDHCREEVLGEEYHMPDPSGNGNDQGSFCSPECSKSTALYECGREDVANLIDQMEGMEITPAAPWTQLKVVIGEGGLIREDWSNTMTMDREDAPEVFIEDTGKQKRGKKGD